MSGYTPRHQPRPVGPAQREANRAWREWDAERRRLNEHANKLIAEQRWAELVEYNQTVVAAHAAKEPNQCA